MDSSKISASSQRPRLYLGCKKEGCNGVLCIPQDAKHGDPFQCPRCLNKQKFCLDCQQLYINFRRHRDIGHELYEFQRKRQVLLRNNHGLFVPGNVATASCEEDLCNEHAMNFGGDVVGTAHRVAPKVHYVYPMRYSHHQLYHHYNHPQGDCTEERWPDSPDYPSESMELVEDVAMDDASGILVRLLHSSSKPKGDSGAGSQCLAYKNEDWNNGMKRGRVRPLPQSCSSASTTDGGFGIPPKAAVGRNRLSLSISHV